MLNECDVSNKKNSNSQEAALRSCSKGKTY
jgi:hypothetical protein